MQDNIPIPPKKYEYLDHTADVQLHAWGDSLKEAFEQVATAMFEYMTQDFSTVEMKSKMEIEASDDFFFPRVIKITEFDKVNFRIKATGWGEPFQLGKHPQGTEVKAITYSNMQIYDEEGKHEVFVIIDI
nr:unnamed protein product [Spirometra erinaceieuropaei]